MTVSFKAPVKSAVVNNAFVSKQANDVKVGQLGLNKASEGNQIFSVQKSVNELFDVTGTGEGDPNAKNYNNNNYIADGDSHKTAIEKLDAQVKNNADTIGDHINEALDAHDASAVSYDNTDSGLVAINTQDAIDEVESRLDTAETNISNHINNATDAHDASAISYVNTASGLVAINAQAAIDEVESRLGTAESDIQAIEDSIGQANGIAPLNGSSKIDATYLPSYVDDVLEFADIASLPLVGEQGKIYVTLDTNKTYRWTGSVYVEISASPVTSVNSQTGVVVLDADDIAETAARYWSKKNNVANTMPLVTNDASENYSVGSQWYDAINDTLYICEDATIGAAVWQPISGAGGGVGSVDIMFADTFENTDIADYTITQPLASISDVSPLQGENSLLIAHDFNPDYYIERIIPVDNKFKNKNVTFTLDVFTNAASGDLTLSVWDHTNTVQLLNSELIQPQDIDQTSAKRSFSFNIPSGANELRYRINVLFDSGKVSRVDNLVIELTQMSKLDTTIETPIITEIQSIVPVIGLTGGALSTQEGKIRQVGEKLEMTANFKWSSIFTGGSAIITLPNSLSIDTSKLSGGTPTNTDIILGKATLYDSSASASYFGSIVYNSTTSVIVKYDFNTNGNAYPSTLNSTNINTTLPFTWAANDEITIDFSVPILGWEATETQSVSLAQTVLVQESDSFVKALGNAGQAITTDVTDIPFILTSSQGNSLQWNGASVTILEDGIYTFTGGVAFTASVDRAIEVYKNGVRQFRVSEPGSRSTYEISHNDYLNTGDVISFRAAAAGGTLLNNSTFHNLNVTKHGSLKQLNVSENQKIEIPTSELRMQGASSRGSTATTIVRFDSIAILRGDAFTVESDAVLGTRVTMKKKGVLNISASLRNIVGNVGIYISKNQQVLTTFPTASETLAADSTVTTSGFASASAHLMVDIGDVLRVVMSSGPSADAINSFNLFFQEQEVAVSVTNVLPQFSESDSSVRVDTANGYGSTLNNKIRRFSAQRENLGSSVLYVDDPANGARFEIKENGIYHISYTDQCNSNTSIGISLNSSELTTVVDNIAVTSRLASSYIVGGASAGGNVSWQGYLQSGDVIRAHSQGLASAINSVVSFTISKVGKPNVTGVDVTPFAKIEYEVKQFIESLTATSTFGGTRTGVPVLNITKNTNNGLIRVDSSAANGTEFVALKRCEVYMSANATGDNASVFITKNSTIFTLTDPDGILARSGISGVTNRLHCSATVELIAGDILRVQRNTNTVTPIDDVLIVATELRDAYQVIGGGIENTYSARIASGAAITSQSYPFIQSVTSGGTGIYDIVFVSGFFVNAPSVIVTPEETNREASAKTLTANSVRVEIRIPSTATLSNQPFSITVQRQGSDYRTPSKAIGLPAQRIAVLKDVKANNTSGGSASTTYTARVLNTIQDPTGMVVNASSFSGTGGTNSSIILGAGKYKLTAKAPTFGISDAGTNLGGRSRIRLYNVTDALSVAIGQFTQPAGGQSGNIAAMDNAELDCYFTLTSQKTLEIQHRFSTVTASSLGTPANFSEDEVYTVVVIEKIEE